MEGLRLVVIFGFCFLLSAAQNFAWASSRCATSLRHLIENVETEIRGREANGQFIRPTFFDFNRDREASRTWNGGTPPELIRGLLPEGVNLVDHPLLGASEAGVVKDAGSGEFVSIRASVNGVGTVLGVSRTALMSNLNRTVKSLVRENAQAVVIFMHGGGTRTTGHHVGINLMNYFANRGVDVISLDLPWHGEGPREIYRSPREYFEWLRALIQQYVSVANKPVFLAGHSMGGEFADTYMRLYPNDTLVKGVMALSPPIDSAPGKTLAEKMKLNEARDHATRGEHSQTPVDRDLLLGLVSQNKLSFTALLFESLFSSQTSWVLPEPSPSYIPALYVWGEKDWLYVGNEATVEKYLRPLSNVRIRIYDKRYDITEKRDVDVGHLIFDHHRPGTSEIEAFADMREFVENIIGKKLEPQKASGKSDDLLRKIVQTYINNLAFREFVNGYVVYRRVADPQKMQDLNARANAIQNQTGENETLEYQRIRKLREGYFLPQDVSGDIGRQWEAEYQRNRQEELEMKKRAEALKADLEDLRIKIRQSEKLYAKHVSEVTNPELHQRDLEIERALGELFSLNERIEGLINKFYLDRLSEPSPSFEPTPEISKAIRLYEEKIQSYLALKSTKTRFVQELALSGSLGLEIRALHIGLNGEAVPPRGDAYGAGSLRWREAHLGSELQELESRLIDFQDVQQQLLIKLTGAYSEGLYRYEAVDLKDLFAKPSNEWAKYQSFFQAAWSRWQLLWKDRPPIEKTSFY